jgi:predicted nuclease of predicted toxin-antitoxin system
MWLLDANLPIKLVGVLESVGIVCETAQSRGWKQLRNGELVAAAASAGFSCIITRDVLFSESSSKSLKAHAQMAIVLIRLPQMRDVTYLEAFKAAWSANSIRPVQGQVLSWP